MVAGLGAQDLTWTLDHIRQHIGQGLPPVPLFNIDVIEASPDRGAVRLREGDHVTRPGPSVAGPVRFGLADVATYALILAAHSDEAAAAEVRITEELTGRLIGQATTTYALSQAA
jgi:acyl-coenzyme A thioesterase PaaI-like protein